jgi:putative ABC transport system permease protein
VKASTAAGLLVLAAGAVFSLGPAIAGFPFLGYGAALCFILGAGLLMPWTARLLVEFLARPLRSVSPVVGRLAVQSMRSGIRRIAIAVFSLAIAVSMLVSVATMVSSFRETVVLWVEQTLRADLYIRPAAAGSNEWSSTFDPSSVEQLGTLPFVADLDRFRGRRLDFNGSPVVFAGGEFGVLRKHGRLLFMDGRGMDRVADRMIDQDRVIVSEPFSIKQGVRSGDFIPIPTAAGRKPFQVEAVFYDYSNDRGLVVMDRSTYLRNFGDPTVTNVAVYLKPGEDTLGSRRAIAERLSASHLRIVTNADLKKQVLAVFDQTFQITFVLEAIAIVVAVLGISNTLAALSSLASISPWLKLRWRLPTLTVKSAWSLISPLWRR